MKKLALLLFIIVLVSALAYFMWPQNKVDFNTQVKPIFNKKCIACHGGVKQQGNFSLLFREEALQKTKSGKYAIIPGNASGSELIRRIKLKDEEERMPYKHEALSATEIKILENWIEQGAEWGTHWAYAAVQKTEVPQEQNQWIKNDIDKFIFKKLKQEKLQPSAMADKATLLRRVSLDLIGLPPSENIAQQFLKDTIANAYTILVDSLLASPAYGEKWTSMWLDLARYADTKGYERDGNRSIWRYRDWVIKAFNADKPYNDFLTEQIAGDLMPGADEDKYIATAFHRNSLTNDEGGTDNEEFRTAAVMDRVNTTWSALMGTTFNCVQCHSHPYDPFKHEEYYKFMAFFNNTRDEDLPKDYPLLRSYKNGKDSSKYNHVTQWLQKNVSTADAKWFHFFLKTQQPAINSHLCDSYNKGVLFQNNFASMNIGGSCRLPDVITTGKGQFIYRYVNSKPGAVLWLYADSLKGQRLNKIILPDTKSQFKVDMVDLPPLNGKHDIWFMYTTASKKDTLPVLLDWLAFAPPFPGNGKNDYATVKTAFVDLLMMGTEEIPIMLENNDEQKRSTYIFERGSWLSKGAMVNPAVPGIMNAMPEGAPANRFGLAMWLTDKKNPLTARTMVNRLWEQLFGSGLAETLEDLGTQGVPPVHKELLDYLSWKFMNDYNWSIKKLLKEIVSSAVYQQSSVATQALLQNDPNNILLARYSRTRLTGEQLRDQGLAISGLLSKQMFGASVMPYQPEGIWASPYNGAKWKMNQGDSQYRRAVYTFWKRTAPYPSMINFDGGSREVCVVRRIRTNTPLQALNTLNDSAFIVMARAMALKLNTEKRGSATDKIANAYYNMFYKTIAKQKLDALNELYNTAFNEFEKNKEAANILMGGKNKNALPQDAAMTVVANAMMNLDEWVNKN